jgi:hypothetical protein
VPSLLSFLHRWCWYSLRVDAIVSDPLDTVRYHASFKFRWIFTIWKNFWNKSCLSERWSIFYGTYVQGFGGETWRAETTFEIQA